MRLTGFLIATHKKIRRLPSGKQRKKYIIGKCGKNGILPAILLSFVYILESVGKWHFLYLSCKSKCDNGE